MKLNDARRLAVRSRMELEFQTSTDAKCVIGRDGVVRMPELRATTDLNVSDEFDRAERFVIRQAAETRTAERTEVEALCGGQAPEAVEHHDE